ncbi:MULTISPECIES: cytochrome c [Novosphingobium]|nr:MULTISPECIES: cytochrome c [Novosphingobium]
MDSTVDPSADGLWNSVWIVSNANGVDKHQPRTDEEWHEVRRHAITLIESMNLAMIPGRPAAPSGTKAGLGELTPQQIDAMVKANRPEFDEFAGAVRESAVEALAAIDHKDPEALSRIGGEIDERCEACHTTFWYPNSKRPNK